MTFAISKLPFLDTVFMEPCLKGGLEADLQQNGQLTKMMPMIKLIDIKCMTPEGHYKVVNVYL